MRFIVGSAILGLLLLGCGGKESPTQHMEVWVDNSLQPMVADQVFAFEHLKKYRQLNVVYAPEREVFQKLISDSAIVALTTRNLTREEFRYFISKKIYPDTLRIGKDGIALIASPGTSDTLLTIEELKAKFVHKKRGVDTKATTKLVFDSNNSSILHQVAKDLDIDIASCQNIFAFDTPEAVIKYVYHHNNSIGFIGSNFITQTPKELQSYLQKTPILRLKTGEASPHSQAYFAPFQSEVYTDAYPLTRPILFIDCSGGKEIARNLSAFLYSERGQRIIRLSGLAPRNIPPREINLKSVKIVPRKE